MIALERLKNRLPGLALAASKAIVHVIYLVIYLVIRFML